MNIGGFKSRRAASGLGQGGRRKKLSIGWRKRSSDK